MIPAVMARCAGIDVGKKFLAACVMTGAAKEPAKSEVRKFGTIRAELEALRASLKSEGCTHVVPGDSNLRGAVDQSNADRRGFKTKIYRRSVAFICG